MRSLIYTETMSTFSCQIALLIAIYIIVQKLKFMFLSDQNSYSSGMCKLIRYYAYTNVDINNTIHIFFKVKNLLRFAIFLINNIDCTCPWSILLSSYNIKTIIRTDRGNQLIVQFADESLFKFIQVYVSQVLYTAVRCSLK